MAISAGVGTDENNRPVRARIRIVVLGNLEECDWTRHKCYAPVLCQDSLQRPVSLAVQKFRLLKQGECCKNAFCWPTLPDYELVVIVTPPPSCPILLLPSRGPIENYIRRFTGCAIPLAIGSITPEGPPTCFGYGIQTMYSQPLQLCRTRSPS